MKVLVDTSVWIDHLSRRDAELAGLLEAGEVARHPFVIGELACGRLSNRIEILALLKALPAVASANDEEVLCFIDNRELAGSGLGYIDVHLLASACLSGVVIWSRDKKLCEQARRLGIAY